MEKLSTPTPPPKKTFQKELNYPLKIITTLFLLTLVFLSHPFTPSPSPSTPSHPIYLQPSHLFTPQTPSPHIPSHPFTLHNTPHHPSPQTPFTPHTPSPLALFWTSQVPPPLQYNRNMSVTHIKIPASASSLYALPPPRPPSPIIPHELVFRAACPKACPGLAGLKGGGGEGVRLLGIDKEGRVWLGCSERGK